MSELHSPFKSEITQAFYLDIALAKEDFEEFKKVEADYKSEIRLCLDGETRDMSYEEFKRRILDYKSWEGDRIVKGVSPKFVELTVETVDMEINPNE